MWLLLTRPSQPPSTAGTRTMQTEKELTLKMGAARQDGTHEPPPLPNQSVPGKRCFAHMASVFLSATPSEEGTVRPATHCPSPFPAPGRTRGSGRKPRRGTQPLGHVGAARASAPPPSGHHEHQTRLQWHFPKPLRLPDAGHAASWDSIPRPSNQAGDCHQGTPHCDQHGAGLGRGARAHGNPRVFCAGKRTFEKS